MHKSTNFLLYVPRNFQRSEIARITKHREPTQATYWQQVQILFANQCAMPNCVGN